MRAFQLARVVNKTVAWFLTVTKEELLVVYKAADLTNKENYKNRVGGIYNYGFIKFIFSHEALGETETKRFVYDFYAKQLE